MNSAGIGRTGTLIAIYNTISLIEEILKRQKSKEQQNPPIPLSVSIFAIVRKLKEQRYMMVQTDSQYSYIYTFVSKWIENRIKSIL